MISSGVSRNSSLGGPVGPAHYADVCNVYIMSTMYMHCACAHCGMSTIHVLAYSL